MGGTNGGSRQLLPFPVTAEISREQTLTRRLAAPTRRRVFSQPPQPRDLIPVANGGRHGVPRNLAPTPQRGTEPAAEPAHRRAARDAWALLLARLYEMFPLVCSHCGGAMRIIAFITDAPTVRHILDHLGEPTAPPRIAPARGPPLWEAAGAEHDPSAAPLLQSAPAFEFDPRIVG